MNIYGKFIYIFMNIDFYLIICQKVKKLTKTETNDFCCDSLFYQFSHNCSSLFHPLSYNCDSLFHPLIVIHV